MLRNYFLINVLLLSVIAFLGIRLHGILSVRNIVPAPELSDGRLKVAEDVSRKGDHLKSGAFDIIVSKNLFHPSRIFNKTAPVTVSGSVVENEIPQLFGTVILKEKKMAILEDRSTKTSKLYRVNDSVAGFIVSDILEEKVILKKGAESVQVGLRDDKEFRQPRVIKKPPRRVRSPQQRKRQDRVRRSRPRRVPRANIQPGASIRR